MIGVRFTVIIQMTNGYRSNLLQKIGDSDNTHSQISENALGMKKSYLFFLHKAKIGL